MAVQGGEQHVAAPVEDRLGAVAAVVVDVEDGDPRRPLVAERLGGDGGVVEIAVAADGVGRGVVAGGRQRAKAARAPSATWRWAVSAALAADLAAAQVPAVIGAAQSMA